MKIFTFTVTVNPNLHVNTKTGVQSFVEMNASTVKPRTDVLMMLTYKQKQDLTRMFFFLLGLSGFGAKTRLILAVNI